ncbi:hypothetical protein I7I53_04684 [Histoplasma capsulatum var. duboisii H88]|uniref:Uncharacterized protein n=1 Tax=Ajellomyces capsulatus (strain H88) TaxID=544711 RepID=A0A8A1LTH8_AJEC8|nr:hypothetical protein I7I53_04684 [Histoplasma capsulatum var. duboisii H88]
MFYSYLSPNVELEVEMLSEPSRGPYFNRGELSRNICIVGLYLGLVLGIACLAVGIYTSILPISIGQQGARGEVISLGLNLLITLVNEVYGYVHGVSLRWALQREGRLTFNSNFRLLTSSRSSRPNKWYTNLFMLCCIIGSYSSSSLVFLKDHSSGSDDEPVTRICGAAIISLAICLLGQWAVAWWSLPNTHHAPTWSVDPLDTVAACILEGSLHRIPGRCMQSVHNIAAPTIPVPPRHRQQAAYYAHSEVRKVLWALWATAGLGLLWAITIFVVIRTGFVNGISDKGSWSLLPNSQTPSLNMGWFVDGETLPASIFVWTFFFVSGLQTVITLALHCAELHVNCSNDETAWWLASSEGGLKRDRNILKKMGTSWQSITLFCFKPLIHWLYGLSMTVYFDSGFNMMPVQISYLTVGALCLALFATAIIFKPPKGPQPAAFGHLQTLANLIDEWPTKGGRLYWGHKSEEGSVAHAGTSSEKLGKINFGMLYAGVKSS